MFDQKAKIGIWGFGLVGESLVNYLSKQGCSDLLVYDLKPVDPSLYEHKFIFTSDLDWFLKACDTILPSPGIDLEPYQEYQAKFVAELDLFAQNWQGVVWAITGTLGKTTLASLLECLLNQVGLKAIAAGNIGLPMLDILDQDDNLAVLELSSFQLDLCQSFAPDLAVWTNFFPNHLDRHKTLGNYFLAKAKIFLRQTASQIALLPISLIPELIKFNLKISSKLYFFGLKSELNPENLNYIDQASQGVFILQDEQVILLNKSGQSKIGDLATLRAIDTYQINLVILLAIIYLKKLEIPALFEFKPISHRVEQFLVTKNISWYNDSKSTVPQATLAAVHKLAGKPIILFLGGVSKGIDRTGLIQALKNRVKLVICFGGEASELYQLCLEQNLTCAKFTHLESALDYCMQVAQSGDQVLFSPAGASFDLFKNYAERGDVFKRLVLAQCV